jgi:inosose dehydratase
MPLRFAYSSINWGTTPDVQEMLDEVRRTGWHALEMFNHSLDWLGTPDTLRRQLNGLHPATFFGGMSLPTSKDQQHIHKQRIVYAAEFGCELYGLVGGSRLRWRTPNDEEYSDLAAACEELAVFAEDYGIVVAYHPHTACTIETEEEIDILMDKTEKLTLCLDASHIALVDEDPVTHLKKYSSRLGYVHVKDWAEGKFVELGKGSINIDFPGFFKELENQDYDGWVVVENSRSDISPEVSAQLNADYLIGLGYSLELSGGVSQ